MLHVEIEAPWRLPELRRQFCATPDPAGGQAHHEPGVHAAGFRYKARRVADELRFPV
jgi:hypothetical protein